MLKVKKPAKVTKFKVFKYTQKCLRCGNGDGVSLIVKLDARLANLGVGASNNYMPCCKCGIKVYSVVDTWWGGEFKNGATIFENTDKKKKIKISKLSDHSKVLSEQYIVKLNGEIDIEKKNLDAKVIKLKDIKELVELVE